MNTNTATSITLTQGQLAFLKALTVEAFETFDETKHFASIAKIEKGELSFDGRVQFLQKARKKRELAMPVTSEMFLKCRIADEYFGGAPKFQTPEGVTQREAREYFNSYISASGNHKNKSKSQYGKLINLLMEKKKLSLEAAQATFARLTCAQVSEMIGKLDPDPAVSAS